MDHANTTDARIMERNAGALPAAEKDELATGCVGLGIHLRNRISCGHRLDRLDRLNIESLMRFGHLSYADGLGILSAGQDIEVELRHEIPEDGERWDTANEL
jgi:hypothetical protein